jgi:hypothetical protein
MTCYAKSRTKHRLNTFTTQDEGRSEEGAQIMTCQHEVGQMKQTTCQMQSRRTVPVAMRILKMCQFQGCLKQNQRRVFSRLVLEVLPPAPGVLRSAPFCDRVLARSIPLGGMEVVTSMDLLT